ncbi:MAG: hypothetical protein ABIR71_09880 [Chthoniobacterales bacterium]
MKTPLKTISLTAATLLLATTHWLAAAPQPQRAPGCIQIFAEGGGPLVNIGGTLGFAPTAVTFGNVPGMLSSIVTSYSASGGQGQGAQHLTLEHTFVSTDPARPGTFTTQDRAVCAPAGSDPFVCRVNDVLTVVSGTGIFANAAGSLRNNGIIDLNTFSLTFSIRGRVCGDGL